MKRKPLLLALALILIVSAALWGVNYRLDHPPLSEADKEFRALVAGASQIQLMRLASHPRTTGFLLTTDVKLLSSEQSQQFMGNLRLVDASAMPIKPLATTKLTFLREDKVVSRFLWLEASEESQLQRLDEPFNLYQLNPRFEKPLRRTLDAYLPQRIRP